VSLQLYADIKILLAACMPAMLSIRSSESLTTLVRSPWWLIYLEYKLANIRLGSFAAMPTSVTLSSVRDGLAYTRLDARGRSVILHLLHAANDAIDATDCVVWNVDNSTTVTEETGSDVIRSLHQRKPRGGGNGSVPASPGRLLYVLRRLGTTDRAATVRRPPAPTTCYYFTARLACSGQALASSTRRRVNILDA